MNRTPQLLGRLRRQALLLLAANKTAYGQSVEAMAAHLIRYGFRDADDEITEVLRALETDGLAASVVQKLDQSVVWFITDAGRAMAASA